MASDLGYDGGLTAAMGVQDLGRAIDWYRSVMGFRLLYRRDEMGWCELATEVKGVNVGLSEVEREARHVLRPRRQQAHALRGSPGGPRLVMGGPADRKEAACRSST